jgi:serine/threonine-protein kinase
MDHRLGSRYILRERLGRGAMGTVWRATNTDTGADVAAKVLSEELSEEPEMVARFVQERSALIAVQHPNLVRIHDLVLEDGRLAIIMDLIPGPDLHRYLSQRGTVGLADAALIGRGVAAALGAIHAAGIIHRDLKPANVLLDLSGPQPVPKLVDFGIARMLTASRLTARSSVVGTPQYLSPEAISGAEPGPAVDVYALGIALYELFTGKPPFHSDQLLQVLNQHMYQEPEWSASIPPPILPLLKAMLAKNPEARPNAGQIVQALDGLTASLPPQQAVPAAAPAQAVPLLPAHRPMPPAGSPSAPPPAAPGSPVPGQQSPLPGQTTPLPPGYPPATPYPQPPAPLAFPYGGPPQTPLPSSTPVPDPSPSGFFYPNSAMLSPDYASPPAGGAFFAPSPPPFTDEMLTSKKKPVNRKRILIAAGAVVGVAAIVGIVVAVLPGSSKPSPKPIAQTGTGTAASASPHGSTSAQPTVTPSCPAEPLASAARWALNGTTASCAASVGALQLNGGADWTLSRSKGNVLDLNGQSAHASVPVGSIVDTSKNFAVSAWVYLNAEPSTSRTIVGFGGDARDAFDLQYDGQTKGWAFTGTSGDGSTAQTVAAADTKPATGHTWTLLVGVYNATSHTITLYANGVLVADKSGITGWQATKDVTVGASLNSAGSSQFLDAEVCKVQVFANALNATQVGGVN